MTVRQLIAKLKKMPQSARVGFACHDNREWEIAGWAHSVDHVIKSEQEPSGTPAHRQTFADMPDEYVSIRG